MKLTGIRKHKNFVEKYIKIGGQRQKQTDQTMEYVQRSYLSANTPADLPRSINKPSNFPRFRRAEIDRDLRLYWWIDNDDVLVFQDICNHKEAKKKYKDVHKK